MRLVRKRGYPEGGVVTDTNTKHKDYTENTNFDVVVEKVTTLKQEKHGFKTAAEGNRGRDVFGKDIRQEIQSHTAKR